MSSGEGDNAKLKIPLRLDGIFSYFETRKLTEEEISQCEYIETVGLCPMGPKWDPYDPEYSNQEDSMVDFRGDVLIPRPKKRKVLES